MASREFVQRITRFLENHGATNIHLIPGRSKHRSICFKFRGDDHERVVPHSLDQHAVKNTIADLKRQLGPAVEKAKVLPRSLNEMTPSAPINGNGGLVHRTFEQLREIAAGSDAAPTPAPVTVESTPSVRGRFASKAEILVDGENKEYDLVFRTVQKSVSQDGQVTRVDRPVAMLLLHTSGLLALFDAIEPVVKVLRHVEAQKQQPVVAVEPALPAPPKQRQTLDPIMPRGFDNVVQLVEKIILCREIAAQRSHGTTKGAGYNGHLRRLYSENELGAFPQQVRSYLSELIPYLDDIKEWAITQAESTLADATPRAILLQYLRSKSDRRSNQAPVVRELGLRKGHTNGVDNNDGPPAMAAAATEASS